MQSIARVRHEGRPYEAYIVTRSQHSVGSSGGGFGGPDHYVAIVLVQPGATFSGTEPLNAGRLQARGIQIIQMGEYYGKSAGPRSRYREVMDDADDWIRRHRA